MSAEKVMLDHAEATLIAKHAAVFIPDKNSSYTINDAAAVNLACCYLDSREQVKALAEALHAFVIYGCPACHGDCGSANPPVMCCPMQDAAAALRAAGLEA